LQVTGLRFGYPDRAVLQDVTFSLRHGESVALLGVNGSGKTTLLRVLTGFLPPQAGTVRWDGRPLATLTPRDLARQVSLIDTEDEPFFPLTTAEVVQLGRSPHLGFWGTMSPEDDALAFEAARRLGVAGFWTRPFQELSRGERQRVRVALALATDPAFYFLDEPTSHLDPAQQREVLRVMRELARSQGAGVLAVLHDVNLTRFFDRVLVLHEGRILRDDAPEKILTDETMDRVYGQGVFDIRAVHGVPVGILRDQ